MPTRASRRIAALAAALAVVLAAVGPGCARGTRTHDAYDVVQHASRKNVAAFGSEAELEKFLKDLRDAQNRDRASMDDEGPGLAGAQAEASAAPAAPPPPPAADGEESVTNVQHAGVDEGGIVKVHGDHLVVLRRGRLFTVRVGDGSLTPVSSIDAFGPDIDPQGTWYDEMLVGKDKIVVVGYSYERGGTELGMFDIAADGGLKYRATYHLRSNDYYSSRNYASRLIGDKLVFYTPLYLSLGDDDVFRSLPALRKWHKGAKDTEFSRIVSATHVYRPIVPSDSLSLHTVTVCDLAKPELTCDAKAVFGPPGRVFYVSPSSVFVWVTGWHAVGERSVQQSLLYRMPLDGSAPSVLRVAGAPVDQFSFLEGSDGNLNVVVRAEGDGDAMWAAEGTDGDVALLRVPLESFSDGADRAPKSAYHALPKPNGYTFQNRFVGDFVLYGTGNGWDMPDKQKGELYSYRFADAGARASKISLPHGVDRIEALGKNALVVGTDGKDLSFSPIGLDGDPSPAKRYTRPNASQGELRSHGFFYKPDGDDTGFIGLPIAEAGRPGYEHLFQQSASVLFLRNDDLALSELGTLGAKAENAADDGCKASCVDWYGNARPLFLKGRIYALLGYEIVEGSIDGGRIHEVRRVTFAPKPPKLAR